MASQAPWWQFWRRGSSDSEDGEELRPPEPLPPQPSAAHDRELKTVNVAVAVNGVIFVAKIFTWLTTGSGALLAEGLHSLADVANQLLLKHGVIRSRRKPTRQHQYGFHKEKYVYALISAACVFCIGCGASVLHGISSLANPHPLGDMSQGLVVLLASGLLEFYSLTVAYRSIQASAQEQNTNVWEYIRRGRDPTTVAILWEDGGAVVGLLLAGIFSGLTYATGHPAWDAWGSISVGVLMGAIALQLMKSNKRFLIGQAMDEKVERGIVEHLQNDDMVVRVIDPKSEEMGDGVYRFKAEIQWSGQHVVQKYVSGLGRAALYKQLQAAACRTNVEPQVMNDAIDAAMMEFGQGVIRTVGTEIDRLESELKEMVPGLIYVDLETDKGSNIRDSLMQSMDIEDGARIGATSSGSGGGREQGGQPPAVPA